MKKKQVVLKKIYYVISAHELNIEVFFYLIYIIIIITINLFFKIILLYSWSYIKFMILSV